MYSIKLNPADRYLILKVEGTFTEKEYREYEQKLMDFAASIDFRRSAVITDLLSNPIMHPVPNDLVKAVGEMMKLLGVVCIARVFDPQNSSNVESIRKMIVSSGYVANYFTDMMSAIAFVKKTLAGFPGDPVITLEEARNIFKEKYASTGFRL